VVRRTSLVNGLTFLPWVRGDSGEAFGGAVFSDKDGLPALSAKQQRRLVRWRRAGLAAGCTMFAQAGCEHIVQEMVTDCSFVAALCASVEHERQFSRQVVTRHVYPRRRGQAAVSGSGKYLVKLFVNGLWRRVVIDDRLPAGAGGRLLCTYSTRGDIGPSLLEKAFLKVMGGYDFPGSNSSTDLHVLTGWVPEHVFVHDAGFDAGATWARLADGARHGTVLATIATGEIGATAAGALGLVPAHAYAVLDVREVCGERLLKLKNPWSALRWTGRFSPDDAARWTPALMRALGYDPAAEREDCGLFWIDYASACQHFDAIHLNWDPRAFAHSAATHFEWAAGAGPQQALYDFSGNPQFTVVPATVWALLSKHLLKTAPNGDFIALHVYADGQRVYEPRGALLIGEYTNAPHVLVRLSAAAGARYTLVVAQRDKTASLFFTLRLFGDAALQLSRAPQPAFSEAYRLTVAARASGVVALRAAQAHAVNVRVFRTGFLVTRVLEANTVASSGKYRARFCTCALDALEPGSYTLVASTFEPFLFSRFTLTVGLDAPFALAPIAREGAGMRLRELHGRWTPGAPPPRFLVQPPAGCSVLVRLQTPRADPLPLVSVAIFEAGAAEPCASSGSFANSPQGVATQPTRIGGADYLVVPAAWGHGADAAFVLYFYSQHAVEITALADQQ
ncbi:hypothetical protein BX661DRAFT_141777, partial [Kickxella alabastrina]|uniref:uncharacterized protein n=1 Tax=Kickxella alabastrina TaxID=61397 RepID=UPI002220B37D